jgi:hypothetical protein
MGAVVFGTRGGRDAGRRHELRRYRKSLVEIKNYREQMALQAMMEAPEVEPEELLPLKLEHLVHGWEAAPRIRLQRVPRPARCRARP